MRIVSMFLALFLLALPVFANKISGKITDEKTGEAVIGATVVIKGTSIGTATDVDGNFSIPTSPGDYTLMIKYLGYQTKEVDGVHVTSTTPATVNVAITESKSTQLEEVVVRTSIKKENISALYSVQKNAATISDGISADVIKRSPDRSTGEVLKRVSGTTIQDNKFVIVRGLSDRYNTALIDNAILPSTEPNRKAFSFDIIPAAMIDNIVITKAATPDLPGDFAGGVINILTKEAPDQNYNSVSLGLSYNTVSTGQKFKSGYRTSTDFIGFDDGSRKLPGSFPSSRKVQSGISQQEGITALSSLNNNFKIKEHAALPAMNLQAALGRVYRMKSGDKIGLTAAVTYNHNESIKKDLIRQYDNFDYKDNVYTYSSNLGALLNAGYYFGSNKIVLKTLYNRIFDDNFLYREGSNNSSNSDVRYYAFDLIQKSLFKSSVEGEHQIGKKQSKFGWLLSYNNVINDQPDQRKVSYSRGVGASEFSADNTSLGKANNRLFSNLNENILNGNVYYSMPFRMFNNKSNVKVGAFVLHRSRDFKNRYIGAVLDPNNTNEGQIRTRPIETLFAEDAISSGAYYLNDLTGPDDAYTATATTTAGYAMFDNKLSDRIRLVWGARYESYHLDLKTGGGSDIQPTWNDVLPSANFTYSLNEKSNLRASYFRSVARPELRESAPIAYYDYELNAVINGDFTNGKLTRSQIDNIDLRYEIYPSAGEVISASVFYKHFNKTIENYIYAQNSGYEIYTINYPSAQNVGVEVELRKNLGFIADNNLFKNLSFYINASYIKSVVKLDSFDYINGKKFTERPLSGQSPYVINTSLAYSAFDGKLNINVLYNRIGQRLFLVGQSAKGNVYERPRNLLDFQASCNISKRSEIRVNIKDILNSPVNFYFDQDNNGKFGRQDFSAGHIDPTKDWIYQEYRPGTSFSLTYSYKF